MVWRIEQGRIGEDEANVSDPLVDIRVSTRVNLFLRMTMSVKWKEKIGFLTFEI